MVTVIMRGFLVIWNEWILEGAKRADSGWCEICGFWIV